MSSEKVFVLVRSGYDSYTIVGIFSTAEGASAERTRIEGLLEAYSDQPRLRNRRDEQLSIEEYSLDESRVEVIVRVRGDGEVAETLVNLWGGAPRYERLHEGRASNYEDALALAKKALSAVSTSE